MTDYVIVWNAKKNEGVIFNRSHDSDGALDDAYHAGGGHDRCAFGVSSLADAFREIYGETQDSFIQCVSLDTEDLTRIIKDGE